MKEVWWSCYLIFFLGCNRCESAHDFLHFAPSSGRHRRVHFRSYKGHVSGSAHIRPFLLKVHFLILLCWYLKIGRSSEEPIDFVVADTVPGSLNKTSVNRTTSCSSNGGQVLAVGRVAQSTISRFACRLLVERDSLPARAYVYAAGFDSSRNIFLGVRYLNHQNECQSLSNDDVLGVTRKRLPNGKPTKALMVSQQMGFYCCSLKESLKVGPLRPVNGLKSRSEELCTI